MSSSRGFEPVEAFSALALALTLTCLSVSCDARESPGGAMLQMQIKLPRALREVSGLAVTERGTLLAVADEQALIFEIDPAQATVEPWLAIGSPPLAGDFEGIERVGTKVWLLQSDGVLLWSDGDAYERVDTGLGKACEFEGLAQDPVSQRLLLLCKKHRDKAFRDQLQLLAVDAGTGVPDANADLRFDLRPLFAALGTRKFNPSGVAFARGGREILVVAAKQRSLAVFNRDGELLHADRLPEIGKHRQAEGVALLADGRIAIADEGGNKAGKLSIYERIYE